MTTAVEDPKTAAKAKVKPSPPQKAETQPETSGPEWKYRSPRGVGLFLAGGRNPEPNKTGPLERAVSDDGYIPGMIKIASRAIGNRPVHLAVQCLDTAAWFPAILKEDWWNRMRRRCGNSLGTVFAWFGGAHGARARHELATWAEATGASREMEFGGLNYWPFPVLRDFATDMAKVGVRPVIDWLQGGMNMGPKPEGMPYFDVAAATDPYGFRMDLFAEVIARSVQPSDEPPIVRGEWANLEEGNPERMIEAWICSFHHLMRRSAEDQRPDPAKLGAWAEGIFRATGIRPVLLNARGEFEEHLECFRAAAAGGAARVLFSADPLNAYARRDNDRFEEQFRQMQDEYDLASKPAGDDVSA